MVATHFPCVCTSTLLRPPSPVKGRRSSRDRIHWSEALRPCRPRGPRRRLEARRARARSRRGPQEVVMTENTKDATETEEATQRPGLVVVGVDDTVASRAALAFALAEAARCGDTVEVVTAWHAE